MCGHLLATAGVCNNIVKKIWKLNLLKHLHNKKTFTEFNERDVTNDYLL